MRTLSPLKPALRFERFLQPQLGLKHGIAHDALEHVVDGAACGRIVRRGPRGLLRVHRAAWLPFPVGPSRKPAALGASDVVGCAGRAQQKGEFVHLSPAFTFASAQRRAQRRGRFLVAMDAPMQQLPLPLLGRLDRPSVAPTQLVSQCKTYRDAVRMCWSLRRIHHMSLRHLAAEAGIRAQVISDYLHTDDHPHRRDLPAHRIAAFESVVGNSLITQWIAAQQALTVLEELSATKALA